MSNREHLKLPDWSSPLGKRWLIHCHMGSGIWGQPWGSCLSGYVGPGVSASAWGDEGCSALGCPQHETWPLCKVVLTQILLLLRKLSARFHQLWRFCRRKEQQNLIFVIKVRCSSSVCPREAELTSKKMPFPCSHFSAQNSLFMLWVQFCKNPYWGQHNLLIIEVSRKFCFSENWQIKPIRQFFKKNHPLCSFILNIRIQQISWEQPLCKTLIFWEWIGTVIAKPNILLHHIPSLWMSAFTSTL